MHIDIKYTQSPTVTMIYGWTSAVSDLVFCSTDKLQLSNSQIIMARLVNTAVRVLLIHCIDITCSTDLALAVICYLLEIPAQDQVTAWTVILSV